MNRKEANQLVANLWISHFNEKNLDSLLDLYDDNAVHVSPKLRVRQPETDGKVIGKDQIRAWWKDAMERLPTLHYEPVTFTVNDERVFIEYTRQVQGEPDMKVAEAFEINQQGKIFFSRVYHG